MVEVGGRPVGGVVLAGGEARRYGGVPKGLVTVGGTAILDTLVARVVEALGAPPLLVANHPDAAGWRPALRTVADLEPGLGALGGLQTAVLAGPAPVVVVAWDMPFVPASLLRRLAEGLADHDAVLPASDGRRGVEPLCAAYGPRCGPAIAAALARGDRRAVAFHDVVRVGILPLAEVARHGDPARLFFNVNTADERDQAELLWQRASSPS